MIYTVKETLATLSTTTSTAKKLTLTSWNGAPAKLDLRTWYETDDGERPGRGVTLTEAEAESLFNVLDDYLEAEY